jgi:hypothetical protein
MKARSHNENQLTSSLCNARLLTIRWIESRQILNKNETLSAISQLKLWNKLSNQRAKVTFSNQTCT